MVFSDSTVDASLLWLSSLIGAAAAFLSHVLLARHLAAGDYGALSAALATVALAGSIASFGIRGFLLRVFGLEGWKAHRWLTGSMRFLLVAATASSVAALAWAEWVQGGSMTGNVVRYLIPMVSAYAGLEFIGAIFQLEERFGQLAVWSAASHVGRMVVALGVVALGAGLIATSVGFSLVALCVVGYASWTAVRILKRHVELRGHGPPRGSANGRARATMKSVWFEAWPFGLATLSYLIYFQSDIILLEVWDGERSAGIYNVAFTVMAAVYLFPSAIFQKYLLPKYHRWAEHDRKRFLASYRVGNGNMLVIGALGMLGLVVLGRHFVLLMFGEQYEAAGGLVQFLAIAVPMRFVATSVGATLVTHDHMRRKVGYMTTVALLNIALNVVLIPDYGYWGAALATVTSEMTLMTLYIIGAYRHVFGRGAITGWRFDLGVLRR